MKARKHQPPIQPRDWSFGSIPDHHLIACCHWEYARESAFLREFKARCVETNRILKPLAEAFELCGNDSRRIHSIGTVADSFLLGFGFDPLTPPAHREGGSKPNSAPISGVFPAPWQSLSVAERNYRARLAVGAIPPDPIPFQRATGRDALNACLILADSSPQSALRAPNSEAPSLLRLDTHGQLADEIALVQIQWGHFTDDQIVDSFRAWVKTNRSATIRPVAARGHKLKTWRANLTRLAVMRLLNRFSALELLDPNFINVPGLWETKQFSGPTWFDVVKWHDARREARQIFHQLFPFLPPTDNPIAWPTAHTRLSS